jgi:hypothetical protein
MDITPSSPTPSPVSLPSLPAEPPMSSSRGIFSKVLFSILVLVAGAVTGYLVVYFWILNDFGSVLNASVLKGQVISNQEANKVKDQLQALGFSVPESDFHALDTQTSTSYKSNILEGNQLESAEEEGKKEKGFYFRDSEDGEAYYVQTDNSGNIDPSQVTRLIQE